MDSDGCGACERGVAVTAPPPVPRPLAERTARLPRDAELERVRRQLAGEEVGAVAVDAMTTGESE